MNWAKYLAETLNGEKGLRFPTLVRLSNLTPGEVAGLSQAWLGLAEERRRQLMARLVELAEENFELDFNAAFRMGLDDPEPGVKLKAIEGLAENEDPCLIAPLLRLLKDSQETSVQAAAATALGRFILLVELNKLRARQALGLVDELLAVISRQEYPAEVRRRALEAISPLSQPQVQAEIERAYHSHEFPLKLGAIYAMGRNCNPHWLSILNRELSSPYPEMRYEAVLACGELGEEEAVPYLLPLLKDKDVEVQTAAIQVLGRIGGPQAKTALRHLAQRDHSYLQEAAQEALEELLTNEGLDEA